MAELTLLQKYPSEYSSYKNMQGRCYKKIHNSWKHYGGRGIVVCDRWMSGFKFFVEDMGKKPTDKHGIDRINNNGNYSCGKCHHCKTNNWPSNCRWATAKTQGNNKRDNVRITWKGETHTVAEWKDILGEKGTAWRGRIERGWSVKRAFTQPFNDWKFIGPITYQGKSQTLSEWAKEFGLEYSLVQERHAQGIPLEEVFSTRKIDTSEAGARGAAKRWGEIRTITHNGETLTFQEWSEKTGMNLKTIQTRWKKGLPPEMIFFQGRFPRGSCVGYPRRS